MSDIDSKKHGSTRELILGGQKSGKSRMAEARAAHWLGTAEHQALLVATALAGDTEMADRIARHREERKARVPKLNTLEQAGALPELLAEWSRPHRMIIVDCLTLWLTQLLLPLEGAPLTDSGVQTHIAALAAAVRDAAGPVILVSNEIGLGVSPLSAEARRFIDALGLLHQTVAAACDRVTLMVAGCELTIRGAST
jgi:adenosylcobinamide kinase/adenosylcobinamide-phosphate guanylyltransferase